MVRCEPRRILAVVKVNRWPAQDFRHKAKVRGRVTQAIGEQTTPDTRSAVLITLLHTIGYETRILNPEHQAGSWDRHTRYAAEIATGSWAPEAIREQRFRR
jgi:hypothetical protein